MCCSHRSTSPATTSTGAATGVSPANPSTTVTQKAKKASNTSAVIAGAVIGSVVAAVAFIASLRYCALRRAHRRSRARVDLMEGGPHTSVMVPTTPPIPPMSMSDTTVVPFDVQDGIGRHSTNSWTIASTHPYVTSGIQSIRNPESALLISTHEPYSVVKGQQSQGTQLSSSGTVSSSTQASETTNIEGELRALQQQVALLSQHYQPRDYSQPPAYN